MVVLMADGVLNVCGDVYYHSLWLFAWLYSLGCWMLLYGLTLKGMLVNELTIWKMLLHELVGKALLIQKQRKNCLTWTSTKRIVSLFINIWGNITIWTNN